MSLKNTEVSWAPVKTGLRGWWWMYVVVVCVLGNCTVVVVVIA